MASPCLQELLNQMNQQKVRPDLLTFNSVLKALRRCGFLAKTQALHTLNEMKALGIGNTAIRVLLPGVLQASLIFFSECVCVCAAPSLASYDHILAVFYKSGSPAVALIRDPHRHLRCLSAACF